MIEITTFVYDYAKEIYTKKCSTFVSKDRIDRIDQFFADNKFNEYYEVYFSSGPILVDKASMLKLIG